MFFVAVCGDHSMVGEGAGERSSIIRRTEGRTGQEDYLQRKWRRWRGRAFYIPEINERYLSDKKMMILL